MSKLKIVFAGSPDFIFPVLEVIAAEHELAAVITNAPSPTGRGKKMQAAPLVRRIRNFIEQTHRATEAGSADAQSEKIVAAFSAAELLETDKIDETVFEKIKAMQADMLVCYAFGKIFSENFLKLFRYGGINIHPSLLPRWRGATPVPAAIMAGDAITGVTIQTLAKKMDSGKILIADTYPLTDTENTGEVLRALTAKAIPLLQTVLTDADTAFANARAQNESEATYCAKIAREKINWHESAEVIARTVLALTPTPKAFSEVAGERITVWNAKALKKDSASADSQNFVEKKREIGTIIGVDKIHGILVQTGNGILAIQKLQRQGKKELSWKDFLNGYKNFLDLKFE
ncbi:MAG: methionyl-tRNA formyltransferase [Treponemataceae bacterium]